MTDDVNETILQNFELLIQSYESSLKDITKEFTAYQSEQNAIKSKLSEVLKENNLLRKELADLLAKNSETTSHQFNEDDFTENLKQQLDFALREKEYIRELWQNAVETIESLEEELKIFQDNTQGFVPKFQLSKLKNVYKEKVKVLEENLTAVQKKFDELTKQVEQKEKELDATHNVHDNTFKIIKNLEDEIFKLQERIEGINKAKEELEDCVHKKTEQIETLNSKNKECMQKVEEAVSVVEAALNEKDAALFRQQEAKAELEKLTQTLSEILPEAEEKIKKEVDIIRTECDKELTKLQQDLKNSQDEVRIKNLEIEKVTRECDHFKSEIEKLRNQNATSQVETTVTSKLLILEKNLENTFQKLLISEKTNIQINSEKESIKNDLDQMAKFYERDVQAREAEKIVLKGEITQLIINLEEKSNKLARSTEEINDLKTTIDLKEKKFNEQLDQTKNSLQKKFSEKIKNAEAAHKLLIEEMQEFLEAHIQINKKWKTETKEITEKLEKRITELKVDLNKFKAENKTIYEKLKEANNKILDYRKFLQGIYLDVNKITNIALPDLSALTL